MPFSFAARCGGDFRFAPCVAGTCGSPTHAPSLFVIPYSLRSKRTAPATGRGLEPGCAPGFFFAPNLRPRSSRSEPSRIKEGTREGAFFWLVPPASPRQPFPNPCRRAAHRNYSLFTCLAPAFPSRFPGAPSSCSQQGGGGSVPRQQYGTAKHPFPRTAPPAGHRLILNPCRRAAHRNSSLFSLHSPHSGLPLPLPGKAREPPSAGVDICPFICNNSYTTLVTYKSKGGSVCRRNRKSPRI